MISDFRLMNHFYKNNIYDISVQDAVRRHVNDSKPAVSFDDVIDVHNSLKRSGDDSGRFLQELGMNVDSYERLREKDLMMKLSLIAISPQQRYYAKMFWGKL